MGSNLDWWNVDASCSLNSATNLWSCPWEFDRWNIKQPSSIPSPTNRTVAYLQLHVPGGIMEGCDYGKFPTCTDQYAPYTVGKVSQWGKPTSSNYIKIGPWAGVSGISNTGWYWRVQAPSYGIDGAPSLFTLEPWYQLAAGSFVVVAIAYPPNTKFDIKLDYWGTKLPSTPMDASLLNVLSHSENVLPANKQNCAYTDWQHWYYMCADSGSPGFRWYFDQKHLYLRIVPFNCYNRNSNERTKCFQNYFEAYGAKVWGIQAGFRVTVNATCSNCAIQSSFGGIKYYTVNDAAPSLAF
jgi:hypothetical protein